MLLDPLYVYTYVRSKQGRALYLNKLRVCRIDTYVVKKTALPCYSNFVKVLPLWHGSVKIGSLIECTFVTTYVRICFY